MSGRWMPVLLALSLGLNLVVAGAVAGALLFGGGGARDALAAPELAIARALPRSERRALRRALAPVRAGRHAGRAAVAEALAAEPFDPAALEAALVAQAADRQGRARRGIAAVAEAVARMPPAERTALAERVASRLRPSPTR